MRRKEISFRLMDRRVTRRLSLEEGRRMAKMADETY
jgi:hypothetical protein